MLSPYCQYENRSQPMMIIFNIIVISLNRLTSTLGLKEANYVLSEQLFLQEKHRLASLPLILIVPTIDNS